MKHQLNSHLNTIINALKAVREKNPLLVNITNYVVMNNTANTLLAIGAFKSRDGRNDVFCWCPSHQYWHLR